VQQGGVLPPVLFALYVDDIANSLFSRLGCYVGDMYVGCIVYADDTILLSSSLNMLQSMIKICESEAYYLDIKFNIAKSMILRVGYSSNVICASVVVSFSSFVNLNIWAYTYCVARNRLNLQKPKAIFFKALNGILYRVKDFSDDMVVMHLITSYCKPILLYACECFNTSCSEVSQLCRA